MPRFVCLSLSIAFLVPRRSLQVRGNHLYLYHHIPIGKKTGQPRELRKDRTGKIKGGGEGGEEKLLQRLPVATAVSVCVGHSQPLDYI